MNIIRCIFADEFNIFVIILRENQTNGGLR